MSFLVLGLYIDGYILLSNTLDFLCTIKRDYLSTTFEMLDNEEIEYYLGIQIKRD